MLVNYGHFSFKIYPLLDGIMRVTNHYKQKQLRKCSIKKLFLKISQYSQKIPVLELLLIKLQPFRSSALLKGDSHTGCFL